MAVVKPNRPGTILSFVGEVAQRILPSLAEIVAVPIVHDWGPEQEVNLVTSFDEFEQMYGTGDDAGRWAVYQAFKGEGVNGILGAGGVVVYRMVGSAGAQATHTFQNTAGTPANAITIKGKYKGTRGNGLSITIEDDPRDSSRDILKVLYNGIVQEQFTYTDTDVAGLADDINNLSEWVVATSLVTGTALNHVSAALTSGNDGTSLVSGDWTGALDALEFENFSLMAPYNLTDTSIMATVVAWVQAQADANRPFMLVSGGAAGESLSTAITRAGAADDPHVLTLGVGTYHDSNLDQDFGTAQLAPRIAGVMAALGQTRDLTFALLQGLTVVGTTGPTNDEIIDAIREGVTVLTRSTSADASIRVEQGVTTFTDTTDDARPVEIFSVPRYVRVMDIFVREIKQWGDLNIIGGLVDDDTRAIVRGKIKQVLNDMEQASVILPGTGEVTVQVTTDDTIPFDFSWQYTPGVRNLKGSGRVR